MFKEHVLTLLMDSSADRFTQLDAKIKTAFTKLYNTMCQSSVKRVKKQKRDDDYKEEQQQTFDPDFEEKVEASEPEESEEDQFEVVGKTRDVKSLPKKKEGKATSEMMSRGVSGSRGRGRGRGKK